MSQTNRTRVSSQIKSTQSPAFEPLEQRRLMSAGLADLSTQSANLLSTTAVSSAATTTLGQKSPGGTAQPSARMQLGTFDVTYGTGPSLGLQPGYWTGNGVWSPRPGIIEYTRARAEALGRFIRDGGTTVTGDHVAPGTYTTVDFETAADWQMDASFLAQRMAWIRSQAPNARLTMYGYNIGLGNLNRDAVISSTPAVNATIDANCQAFAPVVAQMSSITLDFYLTSPTYVARDLQFMRTMAAQVRRNFPGVPITAFAWGAYNTKWNPAGTLASDDVLRQYISTLRDSVDGIMVWGPKSDNVRFAQLLQESPTVTVSPLATRAVGGVTADSNTVGAPTKLRADRVINIVFQNTQTNLDVMVG